MSLTSILKEIQKLDQKQRLVYQRYNYKNNKNKKHSELLEEEEEDKKIYGYSHSDLLKKFTKANNSRLQVTRPCTAYEGNYNPSNKMGLSYKTIQPVWTKSGIKMASDTNKQFNFLFKEDIFDSNHDKATRNNTKKHSEYIVSNTVISQKFRRITQRMSEKSYPVEQSNIKKQRVNFIKGFQNNGWSFMVSASKNRALKKQSNTIFCQIISQSANIHKKSENKENKTPDIDFFDLTKIKQQAINEKSNNKINFNLSLSLGKIQTLNKFLNSINEAKFLKCKRQSQYNKSYPLFQSNIKNLLPKKFTLTIISIQTLQLLELKIYKNNDCFVDETTQQRLNLTALMQEILAQHSCIHMCLHANQTFLYEQFLIDRPLSYSISKDNQIKFMHYYLKRFLLLDTKTSVQAAIQNSDLLVKCNMDIPFHFVDFIQTFKDKSCSIFDKDNRLYIMKLRNILESGLNSVINFKKEMGFGQKVVKIKYQGTKKECRKFHNNNWEYFYI